MSDFVDKYSEKSALGENKMNDLFVNGIGNRCIVLLAIIALAALHKLNKKQILNIRIHN